MRFGSRGASAAAMAALMVCCVSCGKDKGGEKKKSDDPDVEPGGGLVVDPDAAGYNLMLIAKEAGPVITGTLNTGGREDNCDFGLNKDQLNQIWRLIKDYEDNGQTQAQCVDGSNMYVSMGDANRMLNMAVGYGETIPLQSVASNFDFGLDAITSQYDKYYEGSDTQSTDRQYFHSYAIKHSSTESYGNFGHYHFEPGQNNPRSAQMHYDRVNNTLKVNQAYLVNYTAGSSMGAGSQYNVRISLDATLNDNMFGLKLWKGNRYQNDSGVWVRNNYSVKGYGKAEDGYYLFQVCTLGTDGTDCDDQSNLGFYCFQADADVSTILSMANEGYSGADDLGGALANCAEYLDEVRAMSFYDLADEAINTDTDFTGSGTGKYKLSVNKGR